MYIFPMQVSLRITFCSKLQKTAPVIRTLLLSVTI